MHPSEFDVRAEIQYRSQRAHADAHRYRLARAAAGPRAPGVWQARLKDLRRASLAAWASAVASGKGALARRRASREVEAKPGEQCC